MRYLLRSARLRAMLPDLVGGTARGVVRLPFPKFAPRQGARRPTAHHHTNASGKRTMFAPVSGLQAPSSSVPFHPPRNSRGLSDQRCRILRGGGVFEVHRRDEFGNLLSLHARRPARAIGPGKLKRATSISSTRRLSHQHVAAKPFRADRMDPSYLVEQDRYPLGAGGAIP